MFEVAYNSCRGMCKALANRVEYWNTCAVNSSDASRGMCDIVRRDHFVQWADS
jgi:hypothetical protein